jgi:cytoskeletal protein CcmA (bactofilin family)
VTPDCPTELTLSMHADRALPAGEAVAAERHLAGCAECQARLARLRREVSIVAAALSHDVEPVVVPPYRRPVSRLAMAVTTAGGLLVAMVVTLVWDLIGNLVTGPISWFNPFDRATYADLGVEVVLYLAKHGGAIMASVAKTALIAVITTLVGWFALTRRRSNGTPLLFAALLGIAALAPQPSHALTIRHDEKSVAIPAGETIDDTVIVSAEHVDIAGNVTGDLIVAGREIRIRGRVGGQVLAAGRTVDISGDVAGSVTAAAATLGVSSAHIGNNLFGAGSTVDVATQARIDGNAVLAAERVLLAGTVGRDVLGGGETVDISGTLGGKLTAYAGALNVLAPAHIAGDVVGYVDGTDNLSVAPGAVVGGEVQTKLLERDVEKNRYLSPGFYVAQLLRFAAAFVVGLILFTLAPQLRTISIDSAGAALRAAGVGLVALVATPIIAVLVALTVIGIPLGVFGLLLWVVGLYLAKIIVGDLIGDRLLDSEDEPPHFALPLALGLALVIVLVNLPLVGGVISFLLTVFGLGLLVLHLQRQFAER